MHDAWSNKILSGKIADLIWLLSILQHKTVFFMGEIGLCHIRSFVQFSYTNHAIRSAYERDFFNLSANESIQLVDAIKQWY